MTLSIALRSADAAAVHTPLLAVLLPVGQELPAALRSLDTALGGALTRSIARRDFRGGRDETLHLSGGASGPERVLLVGMGAPIDRGAAVRRAATLAARQAHKMGAGGVTILAPPTDSADVESIAVGLQLGCWEYIDLKTPPPADEARAPLSEAVIICGDDDSARAALAAGLAMGAGYDLSRRLAMMPGNVCTPDLLADTARDIAKRHGLEIKVLGRKDLEELKMGSFLSVAQGTTQEPKLVSMEYRGGKKGDRPLVLVGKGLCFDSGGISIKPAERMEFMKFDMCGAAGVLGAMETIARLALPVNVVGVIGATTNMPSGAAVKPGDVVTSSLGTTIEVINTDAEGRLVLADLLTWVRRLNPAAVLDAATLTGAVVIALGNGVSGVFGSEEGLVQEVLAAGRRASEPGWQLPLWDDYREQIKSDTADIKNTGGRAAGAITAALFLKEFVDYPWVHLDVAGTAYSEVDLVAIPRGPTGTPTGTFVEFVRGRAS